MFPIFFKVFIYLNISFALIISVYIIFSKKNEPKEFPDKFTKSYFLKLTKS